MAVAFQSLVSVVPTTATTLYTVPTGTTGIITALQVTNVHATTVPNVSVSVTRGGTDYYLVRNLAVPLKTTISLADGKLALAAGDIVKVQTSTTSSVHLIGTIMEQS